MEIKLLGSWNVYSGRVERYYAVFRYYSGLGWFIRETGWEKLYAPSESTEYHYSRYSGKFIENTPKGRKFIFKDPNEYMFYCILDQVTEDNWPCPDWAVACELPPDQLNR